MMAIKLSSKTAGNDRDQGRLRERNMAMDNTASGATHTIWRFAPPAIPTSTAQINHNLACLRPSTMARMPKYRERRQKKQP